jgi:diadenosine tetraphosphatase ApaH/serine/threonine PP2A family protein phosphatase
MTRRLAARRPANLAPMRVAVVSDIHANLPALEAVLEAVGGCDQLWALGDVVGYGPHPDAVVERLRAASAVAVQGNHDAAVLGRIPTGTFNETARAAVEWTAKTMRRQNLDWLAGLPETRVEGDFTLAHGSPRDPLWEYLFSIPAARINLAAFGTPYCVVGHTHHQLTFRDDRGQVEALLAEAGDRLILDERRCILNPGSVGQPRDGDPRACAMIIDTASAEVEWLRVEYDIAKTQAAIRLLPLPRFLADRLELGV